MTTIKELMEYARENARSMYIIIPYRNERTIANFKGECTDPQEPQLYRLKFSNPFYSTKKRAEWIKKEFSKA